MEELAIKIRRYYWFRCTDDCSAPGNLNGKARALARRGTDIDSVVQDFSQSLDDCQTQSKAAALSVTIIFFKYVGQLISGDANTSVPDFDPNIVAGASTTQQDFPSICVADCIRQ